MSRQKNTKTTILDLEFDDESDENDEDWIEGQSEHDGAEEQYGTDDDVDASEEDDDDDDEPAPISRRAPSARIAAKNGSGITRQLEGKKR
jgi:hypothetical protein